MSDHDSLQFDPFFSNNYKSKLRIFIKVKKNLLIFAAEATTIKEATVRNLMVSPDYAIQCLVLLQVPKCFGPKIYIHIVAVTNVLCQTKR